MRKNHRAEHFFLGQLFGFGFHHHHRAVGRGDNKVETALRNLRHRRVEMILAILEADARRTNRAHKRQARNSKRSRSSDHRHHVWLSLTVIAQNLSDHVDLVIKAFWKQRTQRAVDQAGNQRFLFGRAALTLEKAARNASGG